MNPYGSRAKRSTVIVAVVALAPLLLAAAPLDAEEEGDGDVCVFVANGGSDFVSVIDAGTAARVADIDVGGSPQAVAVAPDGRFVYALTYVEAQRAEGTVTELTLSVIEAAGYRVVRRVPLDFCAEKIVLSHDGGIAYLADRCDSTVGVVDLFGDAATRRISVGDEIGGAALAVSVDDSRLYVPLLRPFIGSVKVLDPATGLTIDTFAFLPELEQPEPLGVALGPGDRDLFVLLHSGSGTVPVLDSWSGAVTEVLEGTGTGTAFALSRDGSKLFVVGGSIVERPSEAPKHLRIVDTRTKGVYLVSLVDGLGGYASVSVTPDGRTVLVALVFWDLVVAVDTETREVVARIPVGRHPRDVAVGRIPGGCVPPEHTPVPTRTATPTVTPTATKRPTFECPASGPCLEVGAVVLRSGESATVQVKLRTGGNAMTGVGHDMFADSRLVLSDCEAPQGLAAFIRFRYEPWFRVGILSGRPLSEGLLYACEVSVPADMPPGTYPLLVAATEGVVASGDSFELPAVDGSVVVEEQGAAGAGTTGGGGCAAGGAAGAAWAWAAILAAAGMARRVSRHRGRR